MLWNAASCLLPNRVVFSLILKSSQVLMLRSHLHLQLQRQVHYLHRVQSSQLCQKYKQTILQAKRKGQGDLRSLQKYVFSRVWESKLTFLKGSSSQAPR